MPTFQYSSVMEERAVESTRINRRHFDYQQLVLSLCWHLTLLLLELPVNMSIVSAARQ